MSLTTVKQWNRVGNVFSNNFNIRRKDNYHEFDLSAVRVLHSGVDTFKQLIRGSLNEGLYKSIEAHSQNAPDHPIVIGDYIFKLTKSSKASGFQYILKNLDLGMTVLLKSFYAELDDRNGTHMKIEYSPSILLRSSPFDIDAMTVSICNMFFMEYAFSDVAVHIACDLKGFEIPNDFEHRLKAKAKRSFTFSGIDEFNFDFSAVSVRYGKNESLTFGGANSVQFCIYDKYLEAFNSDKLTFWGDCWKQTPSLEDPFSSEYQEGDKVTRLEYRFHHSVIRQFCQGTKGLEISNFQTLVPHLTAFFRYGLDSFRLHHSKDFPDPVWQFLSDDVVIHPPSNPLIYQRSYKGGEGSMNRPGFTGDSII